MKSFSFFKNETHLNCPIKQAILILSSLQVERDLPIGHLGNSRSNGRSEEWKSQKVAKVEGREPESKDGCRRGEPRHYCGGGKSAFGVRLFHLDRSFFSSTSLVVMPKRSSIVSRILSALSILRNLRSSSARVTQCSTFSGLVRIHSSR